MQSNHFSGIALNDSVAVNCSASDNMEDGIVLTSNCTVADNTCNNNGNGGDGAGIHVTGSGNRIDGNNVTDNDRGVDVDSSVNLILRNGARGNFAGGNYVIANGNRVATIVTGPFSGPINGNGPSAGSGATDPFANFAF